MELSRESSSQEIERRDHISADKPVVALIDSGYRWLDEIIRDYARQYLPAVVSVERADDIPPTAGYVLYFCNESLPKLELVPRDAKLSLDIHPQTSGLTDKDTLSCVIDSWVAKHERSALSDSIPATVDLDIGHPFDEESLDDALNASRTGCNLRALLSRNEAAERCDREWWILKPALGACGYRIQVFSSMSDLAMCFHPQHDSAVDGEDVDIMHQYVAQQYISAVPLLEGKKFHIRAYVLALGRLQVFVYEELLVILASEHYEQPWNAPSTEALLTNTSLEGRQPDATALRNVRELPSDLIQGVESWKDAVLKQICDISADVSRAAVASNEVTVHPDCFELFGLDFMLDVDGKVWLLEVNSRPGYNQEGEAGGVTRRLWESVTCLALKHLVASEVPFASETRMRQILDEELPKHPAWPI